MVVLLAFCLSCCSAPPPERFLRLDAVEVALPRPARPIIEGDIQLMPFRTRGLLADRHVVYLEAATGDARPAATLQWEEAPPISVARIVARVLQAARIAGAVLPPDENGLASYWLDGSIERFELVTASGGGQQAVVQLEFSVLAGATRRPVVMARYCRAVPAGTDVAGAFSQAVSAVGAAIATDLVANTAALVAGRADRATPVVQIGQQIGATDCGGNA